MILIKDPYLDPSSGVLTNKLGITDASTLAQVEADLSASRHNELRDAPLRGEFDLDHLKNIHEHLFKDIYYSSGEHAPAFAGAVRVIGIEKSTDVGIDFPHPADQGFESLSNRLDYAFSQLKKDNLLKGMQDDPERFALTLAKHTAELWECHPFRDGNSRATFVFAEHLAKNAGMPFNKGRDSISDFRASVADYVRGDKAQFIDRVAGYIKPEPELSVVIDIGNSVNESVSEYVVGALDSSRVLAAREAIENSSIGIVNEQTAIHETAMHELRSIVAKLELDIVEHDNSKPKSNVLNSIKGTRTWDNKRLDLHKSLVQAKKREVNSRNRFESEKEERFADAHVASLAALPEHKKVMEEYKVRQLADTLLVRFNSLQAEISKASLGDVVFENKSTQSLRRSLDLVASRVDKSESVKRVLGKDMVEKITKIALVNSKELGLLKSRDRGVELGR